MFCRPHDAAELARQSHEPGFLDAAYAAVHGPHGPRRVRRRTDARAGCVVGTENIRVNAIAPAFFIRGLPIRPCRWPNPPARPLSHLPRIGAEGELKGVCASRPSHASNYITGQTIVVDGGWTIRDREPADSVTADESSIWCDMRRKRIMPHQIQDSPPSRCRRLTIPRTVTPPSTTMVWPVM